MSGVFAELSDVTAELTEAYRCVVAGLYDEALGAIDKAQAAWRIECDSWAIALTEAERELDSRIDLGREHIAAHREKA